MSRALLAAAWLLALQQPPPLQRAIDLYWNGEYERTLQLLGAELDADARLEGHKYRGFSLVALERNDEARAEFRALLEADPGHALDSALVSPKIVEQFAEAKQELAGQLFERGKAAYFEADYDAAYDLLGKAAQLNPGSPIAAEYLQLARERIDLEKRSAALEEPTPESVDLNRVYNIGGEVSEPALMRQTPPRYPPMDMRNGTEGEVILMMTIGRSGAVEATRVLRSVNSRLDAEATRAVKTWRYQPARMNGQPVAVYKVVAIRFTLGR